MENGNPQPKPFFRIRPNLKSLFRGATEEEYAALTYAAEERGNLAPEDRGHAASPPEADASIGGAILWASMVVWQDHPLFVGLSIVAGIASVISRVIGMLH